MEFIVSASVIVLNEDNEILQNLLNRVLTYE